METVNRNDVSRNWISRGFSCDEWIDPPGQRWEDYVHRTDELVMLIEGEVEFEIDGVIHHPRVGRELFIPAGARHSVRNIGRTPSRWLYGYN